ncbi:MAG: hypothetical protein NZT92_06420 [Abditibacteriales bacterium]|nr:hypothetical protein [Abditibacteriales bacterium]MDW8366427.1 hypothetical protein [Abditibacteriales bacterium]
MKPRNQVSCRRRWATVGIAFVMMGMMNVASWHAAAQKSSPPKKSAKSRAAKTTAQSKEGKATTVC